MRPVATGCIYFLLIHPGWVCLNLTRSPGLNGEVRCIKKPIPKSTGIEQGDKSLSDIKLIITQNKGFGPVLNYYHEKNIYLLQKRVGL